MQQQQRRCTNDEQAGRGGWGRLDPVAMVGYRKIYTIALSMPLVDSGR